MKASSLVQPDRRPGGHVHRKSRGGKVKRTEVTVRIRSRLMTPAPARLFSAPIFPNVTSNLSLSRDPSLVPPYHVPFAHRNPPQEPMAESYSQLWNSVANTNDKAEAVLALSKISTDKEGRDFIVSLGREEIQLCINILDRVSFDLHLPLSSSQMVHQGIVETNLGPTEKQNFFFLLSRLAERHGRLPDRMMMTTKIEVLDEIPILGGVIGPIMYEGCPVAVKIARYAFSWDLKKIKK